MFVYLHKYYLAIYTNLHKKPSPGGRLWQAADCRPYNGNDKENRYVPGRYIAVVLLCRKGSNIALRF